MGLSLKTFSARLMTHCTLQQNNQFLICARSDSSKILVESANHLIAALFLDYEDNSLKLFRSREVFYD
jgi:hypothetical protein